MLSQLEFKLSVEKQYKDGIEKMVLLYQRDGDRKSRQEAEARRVESTQKIQLLKQALKRYEDLHIDMDESEDTADGVHFLLETSLCWLTHSQQTIVLTSPAYDVLSLVISIYAYMLSKTSIMRLVEGLVEGRRHLLL